MTNMKLIIESAGIDKILSLAERLDNNLYKQRSVALQKATTFILSSWINNYIIA